MNKGADASSTNVFRTSSYINSFFSCWTCKLKAISCNFKSSMSCFVTKEDFKNQASPLQERVCFCALDIYRKLGLLEFPT